MFNDVSYWKEEVPGTGICKPANTFSSMFNANSSDGQLEIEIAALANAFSETVLSESDVFLTLGDFFWSIGSGRCAFAAYKRAKKLAPLPDGVTARLQALQKSPLRNKMFVITGDLSRMERAEALFEIRKRGGLTSDSPVNTMNYLVLGSQEWSEMNGGIASRKVQKAAELQKKGKPVQIISEEEFYSMLDATV